MGVVRIPAYGRPVEVAVVPAVFHQGVIRLFPGSDGLFNEPQPAFRGVAEAGAVIKSYVQPLHLGQKNLGIAGAVPSALIHRALHYRIPEYYGGLFRHVNLPYEV